MHAILLAALLIPSQTPEWVTARAKDVLAQHDGKIVVGKHVQAPVDILRDQWGIPHIYAQNQPDLFFAQGWCVAQDRLFQLELWRRTGRGEMAEILGPDHLEADRFARLIRYRGDMDAEWKSYSPDTKEIAEAFTRGINAYIDHVTAEKKLPVEFQILNLTPRKWQPEDIVTRMSGIIMSRNFQSEVARARLIAAVGVEKARILAPTDPVTQYTPAPGLDLKAITPKILAGFTAGNKNASFAPLPSASNNWVVSGDLSASGKPMLASDPHRTTALPSLRYIVHLNAPGWNVIGAGEPGLPGVALGHNEKIAWGITIIGTDQTDLYVETVDAKEPTKYQTDKGWETMKVIPEKIAVKGQKVVDVELQFTRHGPVIHREGKHAIALRWAGSEPGGAAYLGGIAVSRAKNKEQFLKALESWKIPNLNFAYADVEGNTGWIASALTPIRKGWDGLLPVPGHGGFEWQGYLKVADYPQTWNPPWVATANHKILPKDYPFEIGYEFSPPHRYLRIAQRLSVKKKFTLDDFQSIQHENTTLPGQALVKHLKTLKFDDDELQPFVKLMSGWNGVLSRDAQAGPLYAVWMQELMAGLYAPVTPKSAPDAMKSLQNIEVLLAQLEKPSADFFGPSEKAGRDELLKSTFVKAVARTKKLQGDDPKTWSWGRLHTVTFHHPLEKLLPVYAKAFSLGPVARPGDVNTPNNTRHDDKFQQVHGASYRQLFDLSDWDLGLATNTPGQSGQPGSRHYADLLPLWADFKYFPLAYSRKKVDDVTVDRLKLTPSE